MRVYQSVSKSVLPAVHHPLRVPAAMLGGPPSGTLSISDTSAIDGDLITFSWVGSGANAYQLYKDGVWVAGGDAMPCTIRVGAMDAGNYTIRAEGPGGSFETDAVALTVAANDLVLDDFTSGSPSASWTTTSGTNTITGQALAVNAASSGYLQKTITGSQVRLAFSIDPTNLTAGNFNCFNVIGANGVSIVSGLLIYNDATNAFIRFTPNVAGHQAGGEYCINYIAADGYTQTACYRNQTNKIEILWDKASRRIEIYVNELPHCIVENITDFSAIYPIQDPVTVQIGRTAGSATGTIVIDSVQIKGGDAALTPRWPGSKWAVLHCNGQSNGAGSVNNSYSAVTDDIGKFSQCGGGEETGINGQIYLYANYPLANDKTTALYSFIQGIQLPHGYTPILINNSVGSTGFTSAAGWADALDNTGLYRRRALKHATVIANCAASAVHVAIWHQGFEQDTGLSSAAYTALLADFIADYRAAIGDTSCPVVAGGFSPAYLAGGEAELSAFITINDANEAFAEANTGVFVSSLLPSALSYQAGSPDYIHFDAAGYRALGARGATVFIAEYPRYAM